MVECKPGSPLFQWMTTTAWGKGCSIYFTSWASFEEVFGYFRKFNRVYREGDKIVLFRYYDPRVLDSYLTSCSRVEIETFFMLVSSFMAENENGDAIRVYRKNPVRTDPDILLISQCRVVRSDSEKAQGTDFNVIKKTFKLH